MRKLLLALGLLESIAVRAQISFPNPEALEAVKSTQTVVLLSNAQKVGSKVDMKTIITENWKATTPIIATAGELNKYKKAGYSVLRIDTDYFSGKEASYSIKFLKLFVFREKKNKKIEEVFVGSIVMSDDSKMTDGQFRVYFNIFNNYITNNKTAKAYTTITDDEIRELAHETLLLPDHILDKPGGDRKASDPEELLSEYDGDWEVLSQKDIDERISSGENRYYLLYLQSEDFKFAIIVNAESGKVLYAQHYIANMNAKSFSAIWKRVNPEEESGKKKDKKNKE